MPVYPSVPTSTTLSEDITASATRFTVGSITGIAKGDLLVIGDEMMLVLDTVTTPAQVQVQRGVNGTGAVQHNTDAAIYQGDEEEFVKSRAGRIALAGYTGVLGEMELPLGRAYFDPDLGDEYALVDAGATFIVGEWVVLDGAFLATQLALANSKGRVGIIVEASIVSDKVAWVLVRGTFASALFDSDVTTAMELGAAAGFAAPYDSTNHVLIQRATCTVAPSTATSPTVGDGVGTAYIDHPWVSGVATFVS